MPVLDFDSTDELPEEIRDTVDAPSQDQLSKDVIFDLLKNRRRRQVLAYLQEADETITLSELAEEIAAWENDIEVRELKSDQRKRVYVALYQTHLPKMDDAGVIDYNKDRGLITLSENADSLQEYLTIVQKRPDRWSQWYALVSSGGMVWMAGAYLSIPVLSIATIHLVSGLVVSALVLSSVTHFLASNQTKLRINERASR
ncbi:MULTISPECIES: DUF7344 domain-containing protein [Saliphagus]|uniref:ArsR family transcriptional regulator n=1 Tax=Saliphagus infecundisoli TaxID=1849069 RepID=A0ABD5QI51_9EURY|nr:MULTISPECIES: ArsR family transcriptional regulator [Saliphagus]